LAQNVAVQQTNMISYWAVRTHSCRPIILVRLFYENFHGNAGFVILTLNPLTWKIWRASNNASRWQIGFNSAFKGLKVKCTLVRHWGSVQAVQPIGGVEV